MLWFAECSAYDRDNAEVEYLAKLGHEVKDKALAENQSLAVALVKLLTAKCGPARGETKLALNQVPLVRFEKLDWGKLAHVSNWDDVLRLLHAVKD